LASSSNCPSARKPREDKQGSSAAQRTGGTTH